MAVTSVGVLDYGDKNRIHTVPYYWPYVGDMYYKHAQISDGREDIIDVDSTYYAYILDYSVSIKVNNNWGKVWLEDSLGNTCYIFLYNHNNTLHTINTCSSLNFPLQMQEDWRVVGQAAAANVTIWASFMVAFTDIKLGAF